MTKINKEGWEIKSFEKIVMKLPKAKQVKTDAYNSGSKYPIISQEETYISGYCDDESMLFRIDRPVVIFGDHTRVLKYVDFDFVVGADGVKIIMPIEELDAKLLYNYLKWYNVPSLGYSRHYKLLKELNIPLPPLPIQRRIVEELDEINAIISAKKQQLSKLDELAQSIFYNMFGDPVSNEKGWEVKELKNNVEEMFLGPFGSALKVDSYVPESESYAMVYEQKHAIQATLHLDNHFINEDKFNSLARFEVKGGDFIMSCRGTIGKIYQIPSNAPRGIIHPSLMKIRILPEAYTATFFVFMLKKVIELQQTKGNCVQMAITAKELGAKKLILPPLPLQETFAARVAAIEEEKAAIATSIEKMQTLLDARMQEYFG